MAEEKYLVKNETGNFETSAQEKIVELLLNGAIGVLPTDTLYGIVGSALNKDVVERIYAVRKRDLDKPMIVLLAKKEDLEIFEIELNEKQKKLLGKIWPAEASVILPTESEKFSYLHRGSKAIAFRVPANKNLRSFLEKTGPLVAPSANLADEKPAESFEEAQKYFDAAVDFYVDRGKIISESSTLLKISSSGEIDVLRDGAFKIAENL